MGEVNILLIVQNLTANCVNVLSGIKLNMPPKKSLPVGFDVALKDAEEKIAYSLKYRNTPTVAIEDILFQQGDK